MDSRGNGKKVVRRERVFKDRDESQSASVS